MDYKISDISVEQIRAGLLRQMDCCSDVEKKALSGKLSGSDLVIWCAGIREEIGYIIKELPIIKPEEGNG